MVYKCIDNILSLLYADHCDLCGAPARNALCDGCREALPFNHHRCRHCALPLPPGNPVPCCGRCSRSHWIEQSVIPLRYESPVDHLVGPFKFNGRLRHSRLLGDLMLEAVQQAGGPLPEQLLPIPLHPTRLRQRGYNQSLELARPLARKLGIRLTPDSCFRVLDTRPQADLPRRQRLRNLRGAFRLSGPLEANHVALVDDVVTTGSTVNELARLLCRAGVGRVDVWAVARTP